MRWSQRRGIKRERTIGGNIQQAFINRPLFHSKNYSVAHGHMYVSGLGVYDRWKPKTLPYVLEECSAFHIYVSGLGIYDRWKPKTLPYVLEECSAFRDPKCDN
jgi:hypothetical protein